MALYKFRIIINQ